MLSECATRLFMCKIPNQQEKEIDRDRGRSERKKMKLPSLLSWPTPFDDKDAG